MKKLTSECPELKRIFEENFSHYGELGASVSVWQDGVEVASLHAGYALQNQSKPWTPQTLVPVYSATKGAGFATLLLAMFRGGVSPDMSVGELWPEFPLPYASLAELCSHQCGLASFHRGCDVFDHDDCVRALEESTPAWMPPEHGYHPHTCGVMMDELMIRLTGERLWRYWDEHIRIPLDLDFYIKLPESEFNRVATLYPGKMDSSNLDTPFYKDYLTKGRPVYQAFHTLLGLNSVREMNTPAAWTCGMPSFGGVASARGIAKFYQACIGLDELGVFPVEVREWMKQIVVQGDDLTLKTPTAFSCGFMLDPSDSKGKKHRHLFGFNGFGHAGAGGSHGYADPDFGISFAYTMNRMDLNVLPGIKTQNLIHALMREMQG